MESGRKWTFSSLSEGGTWGLRSSAYANVGAGEGSQTTAPIVPKENPTEFDQFKKSVIAMGKEVLTKKYKKVHDRKAGDVGAFTEEGRALMRAYLDLVNAAEALAEAEYGGSELELGFYSRDYDGVNAATSVCFVISIVVALLFVGIAMLMSVWGLSVHGQPSTNVTALVAYLDNTPVASGPNTTCAVESQSDFDIGVFFGIPTSNTVWNIYGGLVLGLIFGFLDNYGLFYGMGALDAFFYNFGANVAAGLMSLFRGRELGIGMGVAKKEKMLVDLHSVTSDLMAGLGNTFSDALGVALGTAALEIAKAGLNVEPSFWALDLVAIVLGCLLGCFMPVLMKHSDVLASEDSRGFLFRFAALNIVGIFVAVLLSGVPYVGANVVSVVIISLNITFLVLMLVYCSVRGGGTRDMLIDSLSSTGVRLNPPGVLGITGQDERGRRVRV
jgi:hypothetical protein